MHLHHYGVMLSIKSWALVPDASDQLPFVTTRSPLSALMTLTNIRKITDKVKNFKKNVAIAMEKGKA
ncbi:MAG: hypothetical protein ACLRUN_14395 [Christensenellales bacterium]